MKVTWSTYEVEKGVEGYRGVDASGRVCGRVIPKRDEFMAYTDERTCLGFFVDIGTAKTAVENAPSITPITE